jgi:hypothetical protein
MKLKRHIYVSLVLLTVLLCSGCKKDTNKEAELVVEEAVSDIKITKEDIAKLEYPEVVLNKSVQNLVMDWNGYQQVASSVSYLQSADLTYFKTDIEELKTTLKDLREGIPTALKSNSVLSRLTVVETTFLKLQNDLTLDNISKETQLQSVADVLNAWGYLSYIMNKKIEFIENDVSRPE